MLEGPLAFAPTSYFARGTAALATYDLQARHSPPGHPTPARYRSEDCRAAMQTGTRLPGWHSRVLCSGEAVTGVRHYGASAGGDSVRPIAPTPARLRGRGPAGPPPRPP